MNTKRKETVEEFLARGGKIDVIEPTKTGESKKLKRCACGCNGVSKTHQIIQAKRILAEYENEKGAYSPYYGEK